MKTSYDVKIYNALNDLVSFAQNVSNVTLQHMLKEYSDATYITKVKTIQN